MFKLLLATFVTLWLLDYLLPNVTISSPMILLITGVVLGLVQVIVKPVVSILLLPLTIITLGLFSSVIQIGLLWLVTAVVPGFHIDPMVFMGFRLGWFMSLVVVGFLLAWGQRLVLAILNRFW